LPGVAILEISPGKVVVLQPMTWTIVQFIAEAVLIVAIQAKFVPKVIVVHRAKAFLMGLPATNLAKLAQSAVLHSEDLPELALGMQLDTHWISQWHLAVLVVIS